MEKKSFMKKLTGSREALLAVILILLFAVITVISPSFLTFRSLTDMLKNNAVTMVMALGMLLVMLVGGIDISIMSTLAFAGMSIGMLLKNKQISSTFLAFVIAMAIGIGCGLLVGLVISRADVPPIIATMGFMYIYRAMGYLVSDGGKWASAAKLGKFKNFATTKFLGLSLVIWVIVLCYVVFFIFMKWTTLGRRIYAVGSNPSAAEVSGINVKNIKLLVYTIMGFLAGLGGALQVSIYASAMPDMQQGGEMDVIAACVIGGVSMSGGRGTVLGALLGSLILATIAKALPLIPFFDQLWLNTIKGVIILVVVVVNIVLQRVADKNALKGSGDVIMAGKSGRSINNVPKSPVKQMIFSWGNAFWYSCLLQLIFSVLIFLTFII